jgi:hypothetical protein
MNYLPRFDSDLTSAEDAWFTLMQCGRLSATFPGQCHGPRRKTSEGSPACLDRQFPLHLCFP